MISVNSHLACRTVRRNGLAAAAAALLTLFASTANAGITFPSVPLQVSPNVPANILFILDDSGSMATTNLPDSLPAVIAPGGTSNSVRTSARDRSSWINQIFYNPDVDYSPWQQADGSFMAQANYTNVTNHDAFASATVGPRVNLAASTQVFHVLPSGATNPLDITQFVQYQLTSGGARACTWNSVSRNYSICDDLTTFAWPTAGTRDVAEEKQNYANWYHYHRTRTKAAKAGASIAFSGLGNNVRVGFRTLHNLGNVNYPIPVGSANGGLFVDQTLANGAVVKNRSDWYSKLFAAQASGNTPLNTVLNQVGQYFSTTGASGPYGPRTGPNNEILACRQNFAILTTDGYRNENPPTSIGNQDGTSGPLHTHYDGVRTYQYDPNSAENIRYRDSASNTLADIAMRYWKNDLYPGLANRVPHSDENPAFWQHMVTFGVSLGASDDNPDFVDHTLALSRIDAGTLQWPTFYQNNRPDTITDFWHATINGRGDFVVATNPKQFEEGLKGALAKITYQTRSNSNVAVTSNRLQADSLAFEATFDPTDWSGDIKAYEVTASGVDPTSPEWSAGEKLAARDYTTRKIFRWNAATESGATFDWTNLSATERGAFGNDQTRFDYVRGDGSREDVFRPRNRDGKHWRIGDISGSSPVYDAENKVVYVGANDGMLHAFDATNGEELFAYVPGGIDYADLAALADPEYAHKFFVDGQLTLAKVEVGSTERTMLFGFLGRGGKAGRSPAFALDVTNPDTFSASDVKWEVTNPAFTNAAVNVLEAPIVARLNNGRVGVLFGNGYNSSTNRAALLVLDAVRGDDGPSSDKAVIYRTGGTAADPNGLGAISAWDEGNDGIVDYVYGGDLHGRVWRFDLTHGNTGNWINETGGIDHVQLFQAQDAMGNRQPITGRVSVGINPTTYEKWIYFGTGRFLNEDDRLDLSVQTWYGMKERASDDVDMPERSDLRERSFLLQTAPTGGQRFRTIAPSSPTDMTGRTGWYLDLLEPPSATPRGERITGNTVFLGNVVLVASNSPNNDPCEPGMLGWINAIDPFTGGGMTKPYIDVNGDGVVDDSDKVDGNPASSISLNNGYTTDPTFVGNQLVAGGKIESVTTLPSKYLGRISWRELIRNDE